MNDKRYNFARNFRMIAIFITIVIILFYAFQILVNHMIEFGTVALLAGQIIVLINIIISKPRPPLPPAPPIQHP